VSYAASPLVLAGHDSYAILNLLLHRWMTQTTVCDLINRWAMGLVQTSILVPTHFSTSVVVVVACH
jgi:hypothetical protein